MKKTLCVLVTLLLSAFCSIPAFADTNIVVGGNSEVLVVADTAIISLGINVRDEDVTTAQTRANTVIDDIRTALLEKLDIDTSDINTDNLYVYSIYDYEDEQSSIVGYNVSSMLAIRVTDMEIVGKVIDIAFENGANILNGIRFSASDTEQAEKDALSQAVLNARTKAETLANAANVTITDTVSIRDGYTEQLSKSAEYSFPTNSVDTASADTFVQAAKLSVYANVTVEYTAE